MVDDFPTDLTMAALVEAHSLLSKQHVCLCDNTAASLCLDCGDMFCSHCERLHNKQSATKHHKLEKMNSLTPEKLAARRPAMCADHKEKSCEVYCPTHGASMCYLCATTTHRKCEDVVSLQARMQESVAELDQLTALLTDGENKLDVGLQKLDQHIKDMQKRADDALQQIQATFQRLESAFKECRRRLEDMTRKSHADVTKGANEVKAVLLQRHGKLTSHKTVTGRAASHTDICAISDVTGQLKKRISDLHRDATAPISVEKVTSFTFTLDPEAVARIERELSQLGKVTFTPLTGISLLQGSQGTITAVPAQPASHPSTTPVPTEFEFHPNHGTKVKLSNANKTAQRTNSGYRYGIVIARDPMQPQMLYEVVVEEVDTEKAGYCALGVLTTSPDTFTVPNDFEKCGAAGLSLSSDVGGHVFAFGTEKQDARLGKLNRQPAGTRPCRTGVGREQKAACVPEWY